MSSVGLKKTRIISIVTKTEVIHTIILHLLFLTTNVIGIAYNCVSNFFKGVS